MIDIALIIDIGTFCVVVIATGFAAVQLWQGRQALEQSAKAQEAENTWNQQIAAQSALSEYGTSVELSLLQEKFDYLSIGQVGTIPLDKILNEIEADPNVRTDLHKLLNYYEKIARGVLQGLYDGEVVKAARRGAMTRALRGFASYVDHRREVGSPKAWCDLQTLVEEWEGQQVAAGALDSGPCK